MNSYFLVAGCLAIVVSLIHSVLGEKLIFNRLRKNTIIPTEGGSKLQERHVRILWASWHIVTVFAWALAFILIRKAMPGMVGIMPSDLSIIALTMFLSALLVFIGTKAKHPGWIGLTLVGVFIWLA